MTENKAAPSSAGDSRFTAPADDEKLRLERAALLSHMRHELRTPVNAIIGYSEMLLEDARASNGDALVADLERIHDSGANLLALINELLDPAQIEKADVDLDAMGARARHDIVRFSGLEKSDQPPTITDAALTGMIKSVVSAIRPAASGAEAAALTGKLLVVDDNEINSDMLSRRLAREGYVVATASDGRMALDMIASGDFDLVLLDVIMPEMNGFEVLRRLKANEALRHIPVIMISALDELGSVVRCIESGAEDYLPKPFNPVLLRARIGACLEKKHLRDREVLHLRMIEEERRRAHDPHSIRRSRS